MFLFLVVLELYPSTGGRDLPCGCRWPFAKYLTVNRQDRNWERAHLRPPLAETTDEGPLGPILKEIRERQKAKAEGLREKETMVFVAQLYDQLEKQGWGEREGEGLTKQQGWEARVTVAELLRRVAWRGPPRGKNKWGWTKVGGKGAPGVFFSTPEEASLYLLLKYSSPKKALDEGATARSGKITGLTGKQEIDERLSKWQL
jgi:hypothetical protein